MKITPTVSHIWTCSLVIYTLVRECPADSEIITSQTVRARLGHSASLTCRVKGSVHVLQSQWSRCPDHIILVYQERPGAHVANKSYEGLVSTEGYHTLILKRVQEGDFGEYCCKLTTYPSGSLEGQVQLVEEDEKEGLPVMMIVYISCGAAGFVVLMGSSSALSVESGGERYLIQSVFQCRLQVSPRTNKIRGDPVEECDEDGMYLNVPQLNS
ncbi:hypothetical protein AOLI_G00330500 [Acnodon oligacanthus]